MTIIVHATNPIFYYNAYQLSLILNSYPTKLLLTADSNGSHARESIAREWYQLSGKHRSAIFVNKRDTLAAKFVDSLVVRLSTALVAVDKHVGIWPAVGRSFHARYCDGRHVVWQWRHQDNRPEHHQNTANSLRHFLETKPSVNLN